MKHEFQVEINWKKPEQTPIVADKKKFKNHKITLDNKPDLNVSAAKSFKGDASLYNPEDLLLSSLASCHFMSYLYCCSQHGIEVLSYTDKAFAYLEVNADGSGRIIKVVLNPEFTITNPNQVELAILLHTKANKLCFIANSCNFPVEHIAKCHVLTT